MTRRSGPGVEPVAGMVVELLSCGGTIVIKGTRRTLRGNPVLDEGASYVTGTVDRKAWANGEYDIIEPSPTELCGLCGTAKSDPVRRWRTGDPLPCDECGQPPVTTCGCHESVRLREALIEAAHRICEGWDISIVLSPEAAKECERIAGIARSGLSTKGGG